MIRKVYIFFILALLEIISYGANFSVAPTRFELDLNKIATNEVHVFNNTSKPLRIETYTESDKSFGEKYNLNKNIAVFPKVIAIKPGAKQVVRFRVKPSKELAEGENKSYLVFKELPPNIKTTAPKNSEGETATNISILTELGISIYGHTGEEIIKGRLEDVKLTAKNNYISLKGNAVSEGNTSIKFRYKVESTGGKILSEGVLGYSPRNGKAQIGLGLGKFSEMAGKDVVVKVFDQKEKLYYEKKIKL